MAILNLIIEVTKVQALPSSSPQVIVLCAARLLREYSITAVSVPLSVNPFCLSPSLCMVKGSSGGVVVKLLACGARGPGFDSWSHRYDFRDWSSPASKSQYGCNVAKVMLILETTNQPTLYGQGIMTFIVTYPLKVSSSNFASC